MDSAHVASRSLAIESAIDKSNRLGALDLARGLVMVLMTFSHSREYAGANIFSNYEWNHSAAWPSHSLLDMFEQIFANTFAAPGFFMLMGIGMIFLYHSRLNQGWPIAKIAHYFFYRGLILVALQFTILQAFEFMAEWEIYYYQGVLFALGISMMVAGYLLYAINQLQQKPSLKKYHLQYLIPATIIIMITVFGQCLINYYHTTHLTPSFIPHLLFLGGDYESFVHMDIDFTPIPWFPGVALGLIMGEFIYQQRDRAFNWMGRLALALILACILLRACNLLGWITFGSYKTLNPGEPLTWESFLCFSKRPPSLVYWLFAIGFNFLMLHIFYQLEKNHEKLLFLLKPLYVFGQSALFFFVIHWFIYWGIAHLLDVRFAQPRSVIFIWILGLSILYPLCKQYAAFKFSKPSDSIWRMF